MTVHDAPRPYRKKLSTSEAADYIGLGEGTLNKFRSTRSDGPTFIKIGNRVIYDPDDLDSWLAQHKRRSTSENRPAPAAA